MVVDHFRDVALQSFIGAIPKTLLGIGYGTVGFIVIGAAFAAFLCFRDRTQVSAGSLLAAVFPVERYKGFSPRIDVVVWIVNEFLVYAVARFFAAFGAVAIGLTALQWLQMTFGTREQLIHAAGLIVAVQFLAYLLANDLATYVVHRAFHRVPTLWAIHRAHHSAEQLVYFTGARDHPIEVLVNYTVRTAVSAFGIGLCAYLTGTQIVPETTAFIAFFLESFWGFYEKLAHSHLRISFFGAGNIVLAGPVMHQMHHSAESHMFDKNYSRITHIWDWLFGTLYLPKKGEAYRWGLNDRELGQNNPHQTVRDFYIKPVLDAWATLKKRRAP